MKEYESFIAEERDDGWVLIKDFYPEGFQEKKRALSEYQELMEEITQKGLRGWIGGTEVENYPMIHLFDRLGAKEYHCNGKDIVFFKEAQNGRNTRR
jgi:hypothetical protein